MFHNNTNYDSNAANKNIWFYALISYYSFFIFMLIINYNKITLTTIIFIIVGIFFLYYCYLLDIALKNIIENESFQDYVALYKLMNALFIESYKSNNINYLINDVLKSDYDLTLNNILDTKYITERTKLFTIDDKANNYDTIQAIQITKILDNCGISDVSILKEVDNDPNYVYLHYISTDSLALEKITLNFDILIVGGGGSGGCRNGGGGGAGALIYLKDQKLITLKDNNYTITIGEGGSSKSSVGENGENGGDTIIKKGEVVIYKAIGGGGGGNPEAGIAGGSSGGSCGGFNGLILSPLISNIPEGIYGKIGGKGSIANIRRDEITYGGGGGGGAGGAGGDGITSSNIATCGNGGVGLEIDITGINTYYAGGGGGGGGVGTIFSKGGAGGGGAGSVSNTQADSGKANTGGGGGGSGFSGSSNGISGAGGRGVVIIRFKKNPNYDIKYNNNIITIAKSTNIVKKLIINRISIFLLIVVNNINEHYFITYLINNYYKFDNIVYKLDKTKKTTKSIILDIQGDYYLFDINKINKTSNSKLYKSLVDYLRFKNNEISKDQKTTQTTKLSTLLTINNSNEYLNNYYDTLTTIHEIIKTNENISLDDMNVFVDDLAKNRDMLKYIDIYNDKYNYLKKFIYIKNDDTNEIYNYINTDYEAKKEDKVSILKNNPQKVIDVIIKITVKSEVAGPPIIKAINDYIIDIETINGFLNDKTKNTSDINSYIIDIYDKLIEYYNKTYDLNIKNFDALYKKNKDLDLIIKSKIDIYIYLFNIIIAIVIIIATIIMHVFYIQFYNPTYLFNV
jgi:uncharacterized protein YfkK (UPF0435 family)